MGGYVKLMYKFTFMNEFCTRIEIYIDKCLKFMFFFISSVI